MIDKAHGSGHGGEVRSAATLASSRTSCQKVKNLVESPEAETYRPEQRAAVVKLAGVQLLFEWRYWMILLPSIIASSMALSLVGRLGLPVMGTIGCSAAVILIGTSLWSLASWRLQRWVLSHRREGLLHAAGQPSEAPAAETK
ncbi:MAG: hypothetical protein V4584_19035 [Verrucomicrobiota bacterium]